MIEDEAGRSFVLDTAALDALAGENVAIAAVQALLNDFLDGAALRLSELPGAPGVRADKVVVTGRGDNILLSFNQSYMTA